MIVIFQTLLPLDYIFYSYLKNILSCTALKTTTATELNKLDGFTGSASKLNFTNNVTSDIQGQIDANKVPGSPGDITWTVSAAMELTQGWYLIVAVGGGGGGSGHVVSTLLYVKSSTTFTLGIGVGGSVSLSGGNTYVKYNGVTILLAPGGDKGTKGSDYDEGSLGGAGGSLWFKGSSGRTGSNNPSATLAQGGAGGVGGIVPGISYGAGGDGGNGSNTGRESGTPGTSGAVGYIKFT